MDIYDIKPDWDTVKKRWEAWWNHEVYDRVLIQIVAPKDNAEANFIKPATAEQKWTDTDFMVTNALEAIRCTYHGGESIPCFFNCWSVGHAVLLGCRPHFEMDTVWVDPAPVNGDGRPVLDRWRESPWWAWMKKNTLAAAQASQGRFLMVPVWGNHAGDTFGLIRGFETFLMDLAENPDQVKKSVQQVSDILIEVFAELWELIAPAITQFDGLVNYCGCWSSGRTMVFDCDVSYNISPAMFADIFLPPLIDTMRTVDRRIFHVDGIGVSRHLELLLDTPELDAIQWLPGAGHMHPVTQWVPLIKRVLEKGKSIQVYLDPEEIEPLLREVKHEGLLLSTSVKTETQAREIVKLVERLS